MNALAKNLDPKGIVKNNPPVTDDKKELKGKPEVKPEVKQEVKTEAEIKTEVKTEEPPKTEKEIERNKFKAMGMDAIWEHFGGYDKRGVVSQAIRHLHTLDFTRSEISNMLGKRYQHVNNVLREDARQAEAKANRQAKK